MREAIGALDKESFKVLNLMNAYGGMQILIIGTPPQSAELLLKVGKLKVGLVLCRLKERTQVIRWLKCLGFGHLAVDCKGRDRSALCWKCGKDGYKLKKCQSDPPFLHCGGKENRDCMHIPHSENVCLNQTTKFV